MSAISQRFYVIINYQVLSYYLLAGLGSDLHKDHQHQHNIKVDPKTDTYLYCILNLNLRCMRFHQPCNYDPIYGVECLQHVQ